METPDCRGSPLRWGSGPWGWAADLKQMDAWLRGASVSDHPERKTPESAHQKHIHMFLI